MGVISANRAALPVCDDLFPIDYLIESPVTTDDDESVHNHQQHHHQQQPVPNYVNLSRRNRRKVEQQRRYPYFYQNLIGGHGQTCKRNAGARKLRRLENSRLVSALVDKDDVCEDLSDTLPDTVSAFTRLFLEAESMKAWDAFIHKSEEEQRDFLRGYRKRGGTSTNTSNSAAKIRQGRGEKESSTTTSSSDDSSSFCEISGSGKEEKRHVHPAYSGSACFRRIENRLKALLTATHKHTPWEKLEIFEGELTDFFRSSPDGVYVTVLESGYDRLLLHAVAQYLRLKSQSIGPLDHRETEVECPIGRPFTPPLQTLASYLRQHYAKPGKERGEGGPPGNASNNATPFQNHG